MEINYSSQEVKKSNNSIFLVGPTPRTLDIASWREEAVKILERIGFDGIVYVPEKENDDRTYDYMDQVAWERKALNAAKVIACWVPRSPSLPAFTTNVEFGYWMAKNSDKVIYGRPIDSEKNKYLDWLYETETGRKPVETLESLLQEAVNKVKIEHFSKNVELDIEELKKLKAKVAASEIQIEKLCTYDSYVIGNIIAGLMSEFEGIKYHVTRNKSILSNSNFVVEPVDVRENRMFFHPTFDLNDKRITDKVTTTPEYACLLTPSNYRKVKTQAPSYINDFIDFLYAKRCELQKCNMSINDLEEVLNEFLELTKSNQNQRKETVSKKYRDLFDSGSHPFFEGAYIVDRDSVMEALYLIATRCETEFNASLEIETEKSRFNDTERTSIYQKLNLLYKNELATLRYFVDRVDNKIGEEENKVDTKKESTISFFGLEKTIAPLLPVSDYLSYFFSLLEENFKVKTYISKSDVERALDIIIESKKQAVILKK